MASDRTIATRCCWPPESRSGYSSARSRSPMRSSSCRGFVEHVAPLAFEGSHRPDEDVLQHGQVREEIERLEDHARMAPHLVGIDARVGERLPEEGNGALVDGLEEVHAAQQRRLSRPRRADQAHDFVAVQVERDAAKDLVVTEALHDGVELEDHFAHEDANRRARSLAMSPSVTRVSGMVMARNSRDATTNPLELNFRS